MRKNLGLRPWRPIPELDGADPRQVSVGIEIEMTWRHAMPELASKWEDRMPKDFDPESAEFIEFSEAYDSYDATLKPVLQDIIRPTIPKVGQDAYWEFSFLPTRDAQITRAELSSLYEAGILNDGMEYALHLTVSDIPSERDAFALLTYLELNGGTTPERIMKAAHGKKDAWAIKGEGGLRERGESELIGAKTAYEFRTLSATSLKTTSEVVVTAQMMTELMLSKHDDQFCAWISIREQVEEFLKENGLPLEVWKSPKDNVELWQTYAQLIGKYKGRWPRETRPLNTSDREQLARNKKNA